MAKRETEPLNRCEFEAFIENTKRFGFYEFFLLELQTGLKFGEIIAITWDDFDSLTRTIQINKIYQRVKDECLQKRKQKAIRYIQTKSKTNFTRSNI